MLLQLSLSSIPTYSAVAMAMPLTGACLASDSPSAVASCMKTPEPRPLAPLTSILPLKHSSGTTMPGVSLGRSKAHSLVPDSTTGVGFAVGIGLEICELMPRIEKMIYQSYKMIY